MFLSDRNLISNILLIISFPKRKKFFVWWKRKFTYFICLTAILPFWRNFFRISEMYLESYWISIFPKKLHHWCLMGCLIDLCICSLHFSRSALFNREIFKVCLTSFQHYAWKWWLGKHEFLSDVYQWFNQNKKIVAKVKIKQQIATPPSYLTLNQKLFV